METLLVPWDAPRHRRSSAILGVSLCSIFQAPELESRDAH